jgi:hypothetical protein
MPCRAVVQDALDPTSLHRLVSNRMGFSTWMWSMIQRIAGFQ